jgi:2-oxoglutarate dehydrogenase E2 component (dihydrolipoamide succinyltransferase)
MAPPTPVIVPDLGDTVQWVRVVRWLKEIGDPVEAEEGLVEVATDKTDVLIESPVAGTIVERHGDVGERVAVGERLALVGPR